jgi:hypothetical protein
MSAELFTCPTCQCPGFIHKLDEVRALIAHPRRHYPCRVESYAYTDDIRLAAADELTRLDQEMELERS